MEQRLHWALGACARVMRPLVRLALAMGVKYPHLDELLRELLLDEARRSWQAQGVKRPNVSQLSVTTGLNRKAVTARVRATFDPLPHTELSAAAKVFTLWLQLVAERPERVRLPVVARNDHPGPSFESVAREASRGNLHHRAVLEELVRLDLVSERDGVVELRADGFVPAGDLQSMLAFVGDNGRDHLLAAVSNTLGGSPRLLERAVYARGLSLADCERIHAEVRTRWTEMHQTLSREMMDAVAAAPEGARGRIRVGIYTYYEEESAPPADAARRDMEGSRT
jgi:hypothetical protein